jgi:DNA-binding MarR family transcriptional regulator
MSEAKPEAAGASLLFLREEHIRPAQDMMFLAWRDFAAAADPLLAEHNLGRAHHRALHFIGRNPGTTVTDLLSILCITKQSLSRVLSELVAKGLVTQTTGREDRRQRRLHLTDAGAALERALFDRQKERLLAAYREAGGPAVDGFRRVLRGIMSKAARHILDAQDGAPQARRAV